MVDPPNVEISIFYPHFNSTKQALLSSTKIIKGHFLASHTSKSKMDKLVVNFLRNIFALG